MLPLIRIVAFYFTEAQIVNHIRFGQKFVGKVANPDDMVIMKPNKPKERSKRIGGNEDFNSIKEVRK